MTVLQQRFLFGTLLLAAVLGFLSFDLACDSSLGLALLLVGIGGAAWWEFGAITGLTAMVRVLGLAFLAATLLGERGWLVNPVGGVESPAQWWLLGFCGLLAIGSLRGIPGRERMARLALAALGFVYIALPLVACLHLRSLIHGEWWVLFVLLVVKGNDIGAFLVGRSMGRTPLIRISPKKTVEGAVGGLTVGLLVALVFALCGRPLPSPGLLIGIALAAGVAGQLGDLAESLVKRSYGVKDSAALIPAFGGALDLLDSILFAAPVVYWLAR